MGFSHSLCNLAELYYSSGIPEKREESRKMFGIAIDYYKFPIAMLSYAELLLHESSLRSKYALSLYRKAIDSGFERAHVYLGRALSPLSDVKNTFKDVKEAVKELEIGLKQENPIAYHELAKLYYEGVGVEKDIVKANELQKKALALNPRIDPLDDSFPKIKKIFKVFVVLSIAFIIAFFVTGNK